MTSSHHDATIDRSGNPPRGTLRGYFVRYRLALYVLSGAAVASGVALNWNWLTDVGLLPILAFLPCMLMMFMCMKQAICGSDDEALPGKILPSRFPTSSEPQQQLLPRRARDTGIPAVVNPSNRSGHQNFSRSRSSALNNA
jgi:hypothetical protein